MAFEREQYLEQVIRDHKEWLESKGERGVRLNLGGADLREAILVNSNFDGAQFNASTMRDANLHAVDLRGSNLSFTKVDSRTKFKNSNLERMRSDPSKGSGGRE
jgi:uncharacterized protein YjbI with pentapeptide repeats